MREVSPLQQLYPAGSLIAGRYKVVSVLGRGSMSTVFEAEDNQSHDRVALKLLEPAVGADPASLERFEREAKFCVRLRHDNIVKVLDSGQTERGDPFLVMEHIEGDTLADLLRTKGKRGLPFDVLIEILGDIAKGLGHAHEKGVIHRDLKPENILITSGGLAKISDFGLCRIEGFQGTASQSGECIGTPFYMAPELVRGEVADAQSDIYSFGVLSYEAATGSVPFPGTTWFEVAEQHLHASPPPLPETLPDWFRAFVKKCMEKRKGERYPSSTALEYYLNPTLTLAELHRANTRKSRRRLIRWGGFLASAGLCVAIVFAMGVHRRVARSESAAEVKPAAALSAPGGEPAAVPSMPVPSHQASTAPKQMFLCRNAGRVVFTNDPPKGGGWKCLAAKAEPDSASHGGKSGR